MFTHQTIARSIALSSTAALIGLAGHTSAQTVDEPTVIAEMTFTETAAGEWDVYATITEDPNDLSAGFHSYSFNVENLTSIEYDLISFTQNTALDTLNTSSTPIGFTPTANRVPQLVGTPGEFLNINNFQGSNNLDQRIEGFGKGDVELTPSNPLFAPDLSVDESADVFLGTLFTPGLVLDETNLFRGSLTHFVPGEPETFVGTTEFVVNPIPEPASLMLVAAGVGVCLLRRRSA